MARLQVPGAADDLAPVLAKVVRINPSAQTGSRTVAAYLAVQPDGSDTKKDSSLRPVQLRPGLFLQGSIITGDSSQLAVPLTAVRTDKPQPYLQLLRTSLSEAATAPSNPADEAAVQPVLRVAHQSVELGSQTAYQGTTWVQIRQGLQGGERILTGTAGGLREGTAVEVQTVSSPPAAGGR